MNRIRALLGLLILILSYGFANAQETKVLIGRVISEDLEPLPKANIYSIDSTVLGSTDLEGYFRIEVPTETNELLIRFIAMEWTHVKFKDDCPNLEAIVMLHVIYDFISAKSERRKRYRRFKKLPEKHLEAYNMGLFKSEKPCVCYVFKE